MNRGGSVPWVSHCDVAWFLLFHLLPLTSRENFILLHLVWEKNNVFGYIFNHTSLFVFRFAFCKSRSKHLNVCSHLPERREWTHKGEHISEGREDGLLWKWGTQSKSDYKYVFSSLLYGGVGMAHKYARQFCFGTNKHVLNKGIPDRILVEEFKGIPN